MPRLKRAKDLGLEAYDVPMGLFDFSVRVVFGTQENAIRYVSYIFDDAPIRDDDLLELGNRGYEPHGVTYFKTGYVPIVWMPKYPEKPREHATFAHEVIHAINHLFDWAAIPLSRDTEEVFAHSVAHVITTVMEKHQKHEDTK